MMAIDDYINADRLRTESNKRKLREVETTSYVPSFQGYLHLDFSVHVPCSVDTLEGCRLQIDDVSQAQLENLVMLFLCSQEVELVVSTSPDELFYICPFDTGMVGTGTPPTQKAFGVDHNTMVLWNLPRFESKTVAFDNADERVIRDMATNTTIVLSLPQQYYTRLHFTYPVYQWGAPNSEKADDLQEQFESSLVSTGTLDSLLPWPNAIAAPTGQEPYVFWDAPTPEPIAYFDTTIPYDAGIFLRWTGCIIMLLNTLVIVGLSCMLRWKKMREKHRALKRKQQENLKKEFLDTEAGVSAILMESKHYALTKSYQHRGDRNISGVEVDLKMVDQPLQLLESTNSTSSHRSLVSNHTSSHRSAISNHSSSSSHRSSYSNFMPMMQSPPSPIPRNPASPAKSPMQTKEDLLLARAKLIQGSPMNSTPWFTDQLDTLLRKRSNDDDDEDAESDEDLQILDLVKTDVSRSGSQSNDDMQDISSVDPRVEYTKTKQDKIIERILPTSFSYATVIYTGKN
eukprot:CAMPEP_0116146048 /NCGR_PEP_ID=MMETSP0329-20121206/16948_1 /TAXON_ID=697910 /ORGANISM="Pseudo-nitzschia arenysensis, Strain B593" /LENGTH=513 /DNA_ID=CAMNT_0003641753 /DNA_START=145 /DNA_END=1687 /DNA_ORIENTATION=+